MTGHRRFYPGTIYCLRGQKKHWWWPRRYYIGQTRYLDYRDRVDHHLYGVWWDGKWNPPKYWAHEIVDYYPLWQGKRWSDWGIDFREFLCIRMFFPIHNVLLNAGNPRRVIPPPLHLRVYPTLDQITAVERWPGKPRVPKIPVRPAGSLVVPSVTQGSFGGRWESVRHTTTLALTVLAVLGAVVMLIPGMPAGSVTLTVWDVLAHHRGELGAGLVAAGVAGWVVTRRPHRRARRSKVAGSSRSGRRNRRAPLL
jgi:hypothetical protein